MSRRWIVSFVLASLLGGHAWGQVATRYFLSMTGLVDGDDDQSAALPPGTGDPVVLIDRPTDITRFYLWADLSPGSTSPVTNLRRIDLSLSVTGNLQITRTNIWQRLLDDATTPNDPTDDIRRWTQVPGIQTWGGSEADLSAAVATGLDRGLPTVQFPFIELQVVTGDNGLFGWVEIQGDFGEVQVHNQASGFLQGTGATNRIFLGHDDVTGGPAEVAGAAISYTNSSPEAVLIPEPAGAMLLLIAGLATRRRV